MKILKQLVLLFTIIGLTALPGCGKTEKHPVGYNEIAALIGQPKETVFAQLALPADLQEISANIYKLPETTTYAGISFDVHLFFDRARNNELFKIRYSAAYENAAEQAADDILTVAKALSDAHGKTYVREEIVISEIDRHTLIDKLSSQTAFQQNNFWDMTQSAEENIKDYLNTVGASEQWKAAYSRLNEAPYYYLDFTVSQLPEENTAYIILEYAVDAYRGDGNYKETENGIVS